MNRRELVAAVAAHTGMEKKAVESTLTGFTDVVTAVVATGEPVTLSGWAKFARVDRKARMGRNPQTGAPVKIKASKKARITPLKGFKDAVMTPSGAPKLAKGVWPPGPVAKAPAKKAAVKRAPAKKAPAKKAPARKVVAKKPTRRR